MAGSNSKVEVRFSADGAERLIRSIGRIAESFTKVSVSASAAAVKATRATASMATRIGSTVAKVGALTTAFTALAAAVNFRGFSQSIIDADVSLSSLKIALEQAAGSAEGAEKELAFLRDTAKTYGVEIKEIAVPYSQFVNAVKAGGGSLEQARGVFLGVTKAGLALGATSDQMGGALRQLQQIASKGKVTLEDLNTVAESLPGALGLAAQSMGITTKELMEMTAAGTLEAIPFLEKFGSYLGGEFEATALKAAKDAQSSQARFRNAFERTKQLIAEGGFADAMQSAFDRITAAVDKLNESGAALRIGDFLGRGVQRVADFVGNLIDKLSNLDRSSGVFNKLIRFAAVIKTNFQSGAKAVGQFFDGFSNSSRFVANGDGIIGVLQKIAGLGVRIANSGIFEKIGSVAGRAFDIVVTAGQKVFRVLSDIFSAISRGGYTTNSFSNVIISIFYVFKQLAPLVGAVFSAIFSGASKSSGFLSRLADTATSFFDQIAKILETINGRRNGLGDDFIAPGLSDRAASIVGFIEKAVEVGKTLGPALVAGFAIVVDKAVTLGPILSDAFSKAGEILRNVFGDIDIQSIARDLAGLFSGADASTAANSAVAPLFQIRDALGSVFETLRSTLEVVLPIALEIGEGLLLGAVEFLRILNDEVRPVLDTIAGLLGFDSFIEFLAYLKVGLVVFKGISAVVTAVSAGITLLSSGLAVVQGIAAGIAAVVGAISAPVLIIVGAVVAIGAAVYLAYKYWDQISAVLGQVWEFVKSIGEAILTGIVEAVKGIPDLFVAAFDAVVEFIKNWSLPALILKLLEAVFPGITQKLKDAFFSGIEAIRGFFSSMFDWIFDKISGIGDTLKDIGNFFTGGGGGSAANDNVPGYAGGGLLRGPGTGTSDSILALLGNKLIRVANGEFVMNARSTKKWLPQLLQMNRGQLPRFATGGLLGASRVSSSPVAAGGSGMTSEISLFFDKNGEPEKVYSRKPGDQLLRDLQKKGFGRTRFPPKYKR